MRTLIASRLGPILVTVALVTAGLVTTGPAAASGADGRVIAEVPVAAELWPTGAARAVKLSYATRNQSGEPAEADGIVYYPHGDPPPGGWKVVSWAHGTSGIGPQCAPSGKGAAWHDEFQPTIAAALARGYVVTAPDYIGLSGTPGAEFLGGKSAAYNVIDLVRAARNNDRQIGDRWASSGHSQGGHAALWASYLAPEYAPELRNVGTVALAPASQIETVIGALARPGVPSMGRVNTASIFGLYVLDGLNNARPELHALDRLTPAGQHWLARARTECIHDTAEAISATAPGSLVTRPLADSPLGAAITEYAAIPTTGWAGRKVRIEQGLTDTTVPAPLTAALAGQLRAGGAALTVNTVGGDHQDVLHDSLDDFGATVDGYFARR